MSVHQTEQVSQVLTTEQRITVLEVERECREILARYGFYADHMLHDEWVNLFTTDAVMDFTFYDDSNYFDDDMKPSSADPTTIEFPLKRSVFTGSDELQVCIRAPRHERLMGRAQHRMDAQPAIFRLLDDDTAIIVSDSVVLARQRANFSPTLQYQHYCLNRWTFRKVDGVWKIAENIRRTMGSNDAAELISGL